MVDDDIKALMLINEIKIEVNGPSMYSRQLQSIQTPVFKILLFKLLPA